MALSDTEIQALRAHLWYGNISFGAYPYTPDGFLEIFRDVIAPNLQTGPQTTATTAITAGSDATVTPVDMTGIVVNAKIVIDVGNQAEIVSVRSTTPTTFSAHCEVAHPATGYPVALLSGEARLRLLLNAAENAQTARFSQSNLKIAGLKQVDKGDVEWFGPGASRLELEAGYRAIVEEIGALVRVPPRWLSQQRARRTLEPY